MFIFIYAVINNTINHDRSKGATVVIVVVVGGFCFVFLNVMPPPMERFFATF